MVTFRRPAIAVGVFHLLWVPAACAQVSGPLTLEELLGPETPPATSGGTGSGRQQAAERVRLPVPREAEVVRADQRVREAYEEDIELAADPQQRPFKVRKLIEEAKHPGVRPVDAYALHRLALEFACQGNDADLVEEAATALSDGFEGNDLNEQVLSYLSDKSKTLRTATGDEFTGLIKAALRASTSAVEGDHLDAAHRAIEAARAFVKLAPANVAMLLKPDVDKAARTLTERAAVAASAQEATAALASNAADPRAHVALAMHASVRGEWDAATEHFAAADRPALRAAAVAERNLPTDPPATELCTVAELWWDAVSGADPPAEAPEGAVASVMPSVAQEALKRHAAELYRRALAGDLSPIERRIAEKRSAVGGEQPSAVDSRRTLAVEMVPALPGVSFDRARYESIDAERVETVGRLREAFRMRYQRDAQSAINRLVTLRRQWCEQIDPANRDAALPHKQEAVRRSLERDRSFGDGWLCESYLHMLDGKTDAAKSSLAEAFRLFRNEPDVQVFAAIQWLDLARAHLLLGDVDSAKRINRTIFQKSRFANDPLADHFEAMIFMYRPQPDYTEAEKYLEKVMKAVAPAARGNVEADAAWLLAAAPVDRVRKPKEAEALADSALRASNQRSWTAWRAKAALRAAEGKWDDAVRLVDRSRQTAPLIFSDQLDRQRAAYEAKTDYWIERVR